MTPVWRTSKRRLFLASVVVIGLGWLTTPDSASVEAQPAVPAFQVDETWLKPLPNNWVFGMPAAITVDGRDHVWVLHRFRSVPANELVGSKKAAPPVVELDREGNVVQAWGGPGSGYDWPEADTTSNYPRGTHAEHGIFVDHNDNVWITGNGDVLLKFSRSGKFLMQIGKRFKTGGNNDTEHLGNPTDMVVDAKTNELYLADGYLNRRIIVFDAKTGKYKRHWGAYGKRPDDGPVVNYDPQRPPPQSFFVVHALSLSRDGLLYVCDRQRNRLQVFRRSGDFVNETVIARDTPAGFGAALQGTLAHPGAAKAGVGSVWGVALSPDPQQQYVYVSDSTNNKLWILLRSNLQVVSSFDAIGLHHVAIDSRGNLYITGRTAPQKFVFRGVETR